MVVVALGNGIFLFTSSPSCARARFLFHTGASLPCAKPGACQRQLLQGKPVIKLGDALESVLLGALCCASTHCCQHQPQNVMIVSNDDGGEGNGLSPCKVTQPDTQ